jgi:YesN/AraC family two-component response regulator
LDRKRILIIDDDPSLIESLTVALAPPYRVRGASSGEAALAFLRTAPTELIILDIRLGAEDGLDLVPRLRELTPARILVLTGYGTRENLHRAIRVKPDDFLDKPVRLEVLRSRVAALLRGHGDDSDPLERVHAWIARDLHRPLTTGHLARAVGMSRETLRRAFADRFGLTPREYLEECRMSRAASLLRDSDCMIKEVAAQVGFADPNNFSTVFKRFHGLCPEAFRARHRPPPPDPRPPFSSLVPGIQR